MASQANEDSLPLDSVQRSSSRVGRSMFSMPKRSQSAVEFRKQATYDPGGAAVHLNPKRARTPRNFSLTSPTPYDLDGENSTVFIESKENEEAPPHEPNERTPLVHRKSSDSENTFSHSESDEIKRPSVPRNLLSFFGLPPSDGRWKHKLLHMAKILVLFTITVLCCTVMTLQEEEQKKVLLTVLQKDETVELKTKLCTFDTPFVRLKMSGSFYNTKPVNFTGPYSYISLGSNNNTLTLPINLTALNLSDNVDIVHEFHCKEGETECKLTVKSDVEIPISWYAQELSWQLQNEVLYAFLVLAFVYILIIFELVHRTLAALLGALAALAVLSALKERPTLETLIEWIDMETLTLLFGMMIIVSIFSETGFFDYSALVAYKLAKGEVWRLVTLLCMFSALVSAFLDNVTTILLIAPVTIRLCEVLNLEPRKILMAEVLFSNIGGTATAIGDPPNVIIVGALGNKGITFSRFTMHMFPGIVIVSFIGYGFLRFYFRNLNTLKNKDPPDIAEMKHEIAMWKRTAGRMATITREETLMRALFLQKAVEIEHQVYKTLLRRRQEENQDMKETLRKLKEQYYIKDYPLLLKSGVVLLVVMTLLFTYSFVDDIHLEIGWIAVLGAIWLLVLADNEDMEGILHKVEWSTLLFFAGLFILMEALAELGMIKTIGDAIAAVIESVDESNRLFLAILVIIWISAIASSFIDNIPYTTAMVPVLEELSNNPALNLPLVPLVVALAFGACLGGNGTLIGASCNVVCAGIAEQHGYGFSFREFFMIGFPTMLITTAGATVYVLLCHVVMDWNYV